MTPVVLPDDLITELLSFLPVKSPVRFKCVCKSWKTLISNPNFVKLHLNQSSTRNPLFTLVTLHFMGFSVVPYSLNSLIENPLFTLSVDPYYHLSDKQCSCMVDTCNGLILLAGGDSQFEYFHLWNPATMEIPPNFGYYRQTNAILAIHIVLKLVATPLIIDTATQKKIFGHYARVLVDVDFSRCLFHEIMVEKEGFAFRFRSNVSSNSTLVSEIVEVPTVTTNELVAVPAVAAPNVAVQELQWLLCIGK
ncbi:F-box and associated interaction domain protein [Medicago truncatula]|uniref:F-box and associated interaction domain protein n=1 Tax=Medicago truncatula TaxID=3880 RepID=G7L5N2_MEDTR|nr:F-box and associated interaction domain protein [Medicago truncatula]